MSSLIVFFAIVFSGVLPNSQVLTGLERIFYYPVIVVDRTLLMTFFLLMGFCLKKPFKKFLLNGKYSLLWSAVIALLFGFNLLFSSELGNVDYHFAIIGSNEIFTIILGITGSMSILGISCLLNKSVFIKKILIFFGRNSLLILVTSEYLMNRVILEKLMNIFSLSFGNSLTNLVIIVLLIGLEFVIVKLFSSAASRIIQYLSDKITIILEKG